MGKKFYSMGYELSDNQVMRFYTLFFFFFVILVLMCNKRMKQLGSFNILGKLHFIPFIYVLIYLFIILICSGKKPLNHYSYQILRGSTTGLTLGVLPNGY